LEQKQAEAERVKADKARLAKRLKHIQGQILQSESKEGQSLMDQARAREERLQKRQQQLEARYALDSAARPANLQSLAGCPSCASACGVLDGEVICGCRRAKEVELEARLAQQEEAALMKEQEYDSLDQQVKDTKTKITKLHKKLKVRGRSRICVAS